MRIDFSQYMVVGELEQRYQWRNHPGKFKALGFVNRLSLLAGVVGTNLYIPCGLAVNAVGDLYVADSQNNVIRKISNDGSVTTTAGNGDFAFVNGAPLAASFRQPSGLAIDSRGNIYIADKGNRAIRKITPNGLVTTTVGPSRGLDTKVGPLPTSIGIPQGIAVLPDGQLAVSVPHAVVKTEGAKF